MVMILRAASKQSYKKGFAILEIMRIKVISGPTSWCKKVFTEHHVLKPSYLTKQHITYRKQSEILQV